MKKDLYILDVSGYIFRAYFAIPSMTNPKGKSTNALFGFIRSLIKLFKDFGPDHIVAVFDGPNNKKGRQAIYSQYKANRTKIMEDLPEQIEFAKQFCRLSGIPEVEVDGVEADDTMGSIAKWAAKEGWKVYLCTSDKDLCQLVEDNIFILNTWKENLILDAAKVEEVYGVPPSAIVDMLAIMGDTSDNIPGLPGFGPKTAVSLLQEYGTLENLLANADQVKGAAKQKTLKEGVELAFLSKKLATINTDVKFFEDPTFFRKSPADGASLREFYLDMDFHSLLKDLDQAVTVEKKEEKKVSYVTVDEESALQKLVGFLSQQKEICFDVESTLLSASSGKLVGIGFSTSVAEAFYVPMNGKLGKKRALEILKPLFENPQLRFFGHNVKYDVHILQNEGIDPPKLGFDTILASYLLNSASRKHSLDHLSLQYFGKVKTPIKDLIGTGKKEISMWDVPVEKCSEYCCEDADYTFRLKKQLEEELTTRKLDALLFDLELPLATVLTKMERAGIFVEASKLHVMSEEISKEIDLLRQEIYTIAGEEFNISSPQQLSRILFEKMELKSSKKTQTGLSTRAEVLEQLAEAGFPIAQKLLEYRALEKLRSTYVDTLPQEIHPHSNRIHTTFTQYVAATGRLACQDPNLQNIPVRTLQGKKIREAFRPEKKGWSYLAADYSQIELRLLAHLSDDPHLIQAFQSGEDIHRFTASLVFDVSYDQVSKVQRDHAKAINFGIIYGQQAFGLSKELGIDVREAAAFIEAYFKRYPRVKNFIQASVDVARSTGKSVTMIGRERELPEINSSNMIIRMASERLAINTPLQGSAADLIKLAMLKIDALLQEKKMESFMVLQVHDELIFEAPDHELPVLGKLVTQAMENVFTLKVPLVVDVTIGKNWGEC